MANMKLKDATKELVEEASGILEEATRIRKDADSLFETLKRLDAEMNRQAEEEAARRRQQEQLKVQSAHTKAFTMLDDDEKQMMEAAMQAEQKAKPAPAAEPAEPAPAPVKTVEPEKKPEPEETEPVTDDSRTLLSEVYRILRDLCEKIESAVGEG